MEYQADPYYFDYAASAPPWQEALDAFTLYSQKFYANPSSIHHHGKEAKNDLLTMKKELCDMVHFHDGRFLLCASGSEANNSIINGFIKKHPGGKILIAEDAHDSAWYATKAFPGKIEILPIEKDGQYQIEKFEKALSGKFSLICINHVCNETGAIQPVKELADICYRKQIRLMIDGMQSLGHLPVNLNELPCTYYTISGHKFGAVKGSAGVFMRDDQIEPLIRGGQQEWNLRAGTENLAGLASMVAALKKSVAILDEEWLRLNELKSTLISRIQSISGLLINSPQNSLPGLLSISIPDMAGRAMAGGLSISGFSVSTGSACHANQLEPSRIILAMGRSRTEAIGSLRISMGPGTTEEAVHKLSDKLIEIAN